MLGEGYLKTRDTLIELIRYTRALAHRSRTPLLAGEGELEECLERPFRIVVCGENGAGKTAFLEKLLDVSLGDVKSQGSSVSIVRNSGYRVFLDQEKSCAKFYTRELKHIELVEASGLSRLDADQKQSLAYMLDGADFVFWILPAENPWAAGTWDVLEDEGAGMRDKSAIVLQQSDRREPADVEKLLAHVKDLSEQRLDDALPMLAVSAKTGAGIPQCYDLMDRAINRSYERRDFLRDVYRRAYALLARTEASIDERSRSLSGDQEYLQSIEAQIARVRAQELNSLKASMSQLGGLLQGQIQRIMRFTSLRTGVVNSHLILFGSGDVASKVEAFLIDQVSEDAEAYAANQAQRMRTQCRDKWNEMRPHLENRLSIDVGDFDEKSFDTQQETFCEEMVKSARYCLQRLMLRRYLDTLVMMRYRIMRGLLKWTLVLAIATGASGYFFENPLNALTLVFAALCWISIVGNIVYARRTGIALNLSFEEALEDAVPALRKAMQDRYTDRVRSFYNGFIPMFETMRRHVAVAQTDLQPQQKIASQLFLRMKALEQEIQ